MASSNFLARMSSLFVSWNQESANLSSRCRCCSCRIFDACVRSRSDPFLGGASCDSTAPKIGSTTSLAWQHGQVTFKLSLPRLLMTALYAAAVRWGSAAAGRAYSRPTLHGPVPCTRSRQRAKELQLARFLVRSYARATELQGLPRRKSRREVVRHDLGDLRETDWQVIAEGWSGQERNNPAHNTLGAALQTHRHGDLGNLEKQGAKLALPI